MATRREVLIYNLPLLKEALLDVYKGRIDSISPRNEYFTLGDLLLSSFLFGNTKEGHLFWQEVRERHNYTRVKWS